MMRLGALILALSVTLSASQGSAVDVAELLKRAGDRVTEYFARAQSIMCLERVSLQNLGMTWNADGPARLVESELRLSWEPTADNPVPTEAKTLRQVLRVNGSKPRKGDQNNCTTPEQNDTEAQPLSLLLPSQREKYAFTFDKRDAIDGRDAFIIAFREIMKPKVDVSIEEDNEECISIKLEGGTRGKIWIDVATHDVLRLDTSLAGLVEVDLPKKAAQRPGAEPTWTMERMDSSVRFKRVSFQDPEETMVLPVSSSELRIMRGAGTPRVRTSTQYLAYRRFLTGSRIVPQ